MIRLTVPLRATTLIDAPEGAVRRALGRRDVWTRTARALGARAEVAGQLPGPRTRLLAGDLIRVRADRPRVLLTRVLPERPLILRVTTTLIPTLELVAGPLRECRISLTTAPTGAGTLVTIDSRIEAAPALLTPLLRLRVLRAEQILLGILTLAAREPVVVVAAAIVADGAVLAARRTAPPELAGRWELPGGKVEPGETDAAALTRELAEELGVVVTVGERVGGDVDLGDNVVLRCYRAEIITGDPSPSEHDAISWVRAEDLGEVDWLAADRRLVDDLSSALS